MQLALCVCKRKGDVMLTCCTYTGFYALHHRVSYALPIEWAETAKQQAEDTIVFQAGDKQTERLSDALHCICMHSYLTAAPIAVYTKGELTGRCMPASLTADRIHDR
jgi:hypothetical protein